MKKCPFCGEKLDDNARFCKRCGLSASGESAVQAKKREIEKLSQNRRKRNARRKVEEKKKKNKIRISEKTLSLLIVLMALAILAVPAIISYNVFRSNSEDAKSWSI